jgi:hypothetical protein
VGDSGEQDLELYTEMALAHRNQILGIFIRDVTTPLLSSSGTSSSTLSLPAFFEGNGQPMRPQGRMALLKGLRDSWRTKSQETLPTLAHPTPPRDEGAENEIERLTLKEIEVLSPLLIKAEDAGKGFEQYSPGEKDAPVRSSKTPPPLPSRPTSLERTQSASSISSANSEPAELTPSPTKPFRSDTSDRTATEDPSTRVKRVEAWKRRLARSRERLSLADSGVEIWTWRVGGDVQKMCEDLVQKRSRYMKHDIDTSKYSGSVSVGS